MDIFSIFYNIKVCCVDKRKYVARPGIEPRTSDLRVRCPTDCAMRPGLRLGAEYHCLSLLHIKLVKSEWLVGTGLDLSVA